MSHYSCHPRAIVEEGVSIGDGTRIWACVHILSGAVVGQECNLCDHTFIEGGVRVGDRVTIKSGVSLWNGLVVEDEVFIGPNAVFTNDARPRSRQYPPVLLKTRLRQGCSLGANSTTLPGLTIGRWAMVGAGAVVTRSVPDFAQVVGNPARLCGWVCRCGEKLNPASGERLVCGCGRAYNRIAENEIREAGQARPACEAGASSDLIREMTL